MRIHETGDTDTFAVSGRGELHLAILIETMRREGYEFAVSQAEVIFREGPGGLLEPVERLYLELHEEYLGAVTEMLGQRRARMEQIRYGDGGTVYCEYLAPTRGLLGFRQPFLNVTRGTGLMHTLFSDYEPYLGDIEVARRGSLVALETGSVTSYALMDLKQRGNFFVQPGDEVYSGQVVGQHIRDDDLVINVCRTKQLTNFRDKPKRDLEGVEAPRILSLDDAMEYLSGEDLLEVTPASLRIRKKELRHDVRLREAKRAS